MNGLARHTDPDTAQEAAASVDSVQLDVIVLDVLGAYPQGLTTEDIATVAGQRAWSISPRMKPLEARGLVVRGVKRKNRSGRSATVWVKA
jgi:chromosome segregation and condensation protein ScpB